MKLARGSYTQNIFVQCPNRLVKVGYLSLLKGGDISFGFSDKSKYALPGKLTYHPGHRVHMKDADGAYVSEVFTFFNNSLVIQEWLWCEAVSNPLHVIESGAARAERARDRELVVVSSSDQYSLEVKIYKLADKPDADQPAKDGVVCNTVEWCGTRLRIELSLIAQRAAYMQPYVMN